MSADDHFSAVAAGYARFRPNYPLALFEFLAALPGRRRLVWDAGCGSGQAARHLAPLFECVVATDMSEQQITRARGPDNVRFSVGREDESGLGPRQADLVTVAQALHWFDLDRFYGEVRRVLNPEGYVAVWCYQLLTINPSLDPLIAHFYTDVVGSDWPAQRRHVDGGYRDLPFPFDPVEFPSLYIRVEWSCADLLGYLGTWSAVQRHRQRTATDPVAEFGPVLRRAWGAAARRAVTWPLVGMAGRLSPQG